MHLKRLEAVYEGKKMILQVVAACLLIVCLLTVSVTQTWMLHITVTGPGC